MTTIQISYNEKNVMAKKTIDFLLSLGIFKVHEVVETSAKKKTLKAIESVKKGEDITHCNSFEEYLKAVED